MAEGGGIGGLLGKTTAGLPNWAWLLVIAGGIAAAIFVPKLFGGGSSTDQTSTDGTTTPPPDVLPPPIPIGGGDGIQPNPPNLPPYNPPPTEPPCSLEHSCAKPPVNGKCPTGMHLSKSGLCRCNAKGMVNWGDVCLPPGVFPSWYNPNTITPPPASTDTAIAHHEASHATSAGKLQEQNGLHKMPPERVKDHHGEPPPVFPPIHKTPRWPNEEV